MIWHDVWPKQRANATRKRLSAEEREYRARVRRNKNLAAGKAQQQRVAKARATTQKEQRALNKRRIEKNEQEIGAYLSTHFKGLKEKRRKQRNRKWSKDLARAHEISLDAAYKVKRRWQQSIATPAWANKGDMLVIYRRARQLERETGQPHHVDHIVPLLSKRVCGLHCEQNLRVMPGNENVSKGNRIWPDMP